MLLKILGTGCPTCKLFQQTIEAAAQKIWLSYEIEKVTAMEDIMQYDIMKMPWLVINEQVVMSGKVPSEEEMMVFLQKYVV